MGINKLAIALLAEVILHTSPVPIFAGMSGLAVGALHPSIKQIFAATHPLI
jgi:hypothetical protein